VVWAKAERAAECSAATARASATHVSRGRVRMNNCHVPFMSHRTVASSRPTVFSKTIASSHESLAKDGKAAGRMGFSLAAERFVGDSTSPGRRRRSEASLPLPWRLLAPRQGGRTELLSNSRNHRSARLAKVHHALRRCLMCEVNSSADGESTSPLENSTISQNKKPFGRLSYRYFSGMVPTAAHECKVDTGARLGLAVPLLSGWAFARAIVAQLLALR